MLKLLKAVASSLAAANMNGGSGLCGKQDKIAINFQYSVDNCNIITQFTHSQRWVKLETLVGSLSYDFRYRKQPVHSVMIFDLEITSI